MIASAITNRVLVLDTEAPYVAVNWAKKFFALPPSRRIGELKVRLEAEIAAGELEARREDEYYVAWLEARRSELGL